MTDSRSCEQQSPPPPRSLCRGDPTDSTEACDGSDSELRADGNVVVLDMNPDAVRCRFCNLLSSGPAIHRLHLKSSRHKEHLTRAKRFFRIWAKIPGSGWDNAHADRCAALAEKSCGRKLVTGAVPFSLRELYYQSLRDGGLASMPEEQTLPDEQPVPEEEPEPEAYGEYELVS